MSLLTTLVLYRLNGILEYWNNGQKRITSVFGLRFVDLIDRSRLL